jgi:peptidoglycan/LPS O-acetylase OafA/YrhL
MAVAQQRGGLSLSDRGAGAGLGAISVCWTRLAVFLGEISYSIYLTHVLVFTVYVNTGCRRAHARLSRVGPVHRRH